MTEVGPTAEAPDSPNRMARGAFEASPPARRLRRRGVPRPRARAPLVVRVGRRRARGAAGRAGRLPRGRRRGRAGHRRPDRAGGLRAHYDVCRHRGSRLTTADQRPDPATGDDSRTRRARSRASSAAPTTRGATSSTARVRNAPFLGEADDFDPAAFGLHPVAARHLGRLAVREPLARAGRGRAHARGAARRDPGPDRAATRSPTCGPRAGSSTTSARTGRSSSRTTTSATTARACTRSCAGSCRRSGRRAAATSTGTPGSRRPRARSRSRLTGTHRPGAVPGPRRRRAGPPQGRARLPEPHDQPVGRPRRRRSRCCPRRPTGRSIVVDFLFHPDEMAKPGFDPSDAVEFWDLVNRQDWAVCEGVQDGMTSRRFRVRLVRADGGPAASTSGATSAERLGEEAMRRRRGAVGVRTSPGDDGRRRRGRRARGHRVRGRVLARAAAGPAVLGPRAVRDRAPVRRVGGRQPDHPPSATTGRDYVRLTARAYEAWAEVERESGDADRDPDRRPGRRAARDRPRRRRSTSSAYADAMAAEGVAVRAARRAPRSCAAGRPGGWATSTSGLYQADAGIADPSRGNVGPPAPRRRARRDAPGPRAGAPGSRTPATARSPRRSRTASGSRRGPGHPRRRRVDQRAARAARPAACRSRSPRSRSAGSRRAATRRCSRPERFPVWIWMDEPSFYGFPTHGHPGPKIGQDVGGREVTPGDPHVRARRGRSPAGHGVPRGAPAGHGGRAVPAPRPACTR